MYVATRAQRMRSNGMRTYAWRQQFNGHLKLDPPVLKYQWVFWDTNVFKTVGPS